MADHNQRHTLTWRECQGYLRLEQTFFVTGFNNSHDANLTTDQSWLRGAGRESALTARLPAPMRSMPASGTKPALENYANLGRLTVEEPPTAEGSAPAPTNVALVSDRAWAREDSPPPSSWQDSPAAQETGRRIDLHQLSMNPTHRPD